MKCLIYILIWFYQIYYVTSEYTSISHSKANSCDNPNKHGLIEHFFNTIFSEFYSSPPVCVCVQMCAGQSTYCYPNGCLKSALHDDTQSKADTTQPPIIPKNKNSFVLLKGERDFMKDFLEKNYVDESKELSQTHYPVQDMQPDNFKKKYSFIAKYKTSKINRKHEMVKKDVFKTDRADWAKIRWPLNAQNWRNTHTPFSNTEDTFKTPSSFFTAMLHDNEVIEYPPKYFKRELTKSGDDDEGNIKSFYHLENFLNLTDVKSFSLEKLIDNLIRSSFVTNIETTTNNAVIPKRDDTEIKSEVIMEKVRMNSTIPANETMKITPMYITNENVDNNKYLDISQTKKRNNLHRMIKMLAKRIDIENNTSMEIARKTIKTFDDSLRGKASEAKLNLTTKSTKTNSTSTEQMLTRNNTQSNLNTETTTSHEMKVTKKNRQKVVKKASSKMNNPDINLKF